MPSDSCRTKILERRAQLVAAALTSVSLAGSSACCKGKSSSGDASDAAPHMCLSMPEPVRTPVSDAELGKTYVLIVKQKPANSIFARVTARADDAPPEAAEECVGLRKLATYRGCVSTAAKRGELPSGTVTITYEVGAQGRPENAEVRATGDVSKALQDCLLERAVDAYYRTPVNGKPRVTISLELKNMAKADAG